MKKGKLIVFEGIDGSGKTAQLKLLKKYLDYHNIPNKVIDFPRYKQSFHGKTVARYLQGEFGSINDTNPYLVSLAYALDRASAKQEMGKWLLEGKIVLADRYATSNMAHQGAKLPRSKRNDFLNWEYELEYRVNKIPKEDVVIYLEVPVSVVKSLLTKRGGKDIHEENLKFLSESEKMYRKLAKQYSHWTIVNCLGAAENILTKVQIHKKVLEVLKKKSIIK